MDNRWTNAKRVLCVRLDSLGDVLMTTPAFRALRGAVPGRHITLLTSRAGAALDGLLPDVDELLAYDAPWMKTSSPADAGLDFGTIARLAAARFDAAVIFTVFSQNPLPAALMCHLAGTPLRLAHCHENPYELLSHWVADDEPQQRIRHEVRRQLDLVATVGCHTNDERLGLARRPSAVAEVRRILGRRGLDESQPWLVVHPGALAPSRRYPAESFAEVVSRLTETYHFQAVFTGDSSERKLVDSIRLRLRKRSISLVGRLSVAQLTALISTTPVLLSNNSGPVHIAAAMGTRVVDLYALTNPQHTPWQVASRVLYHDVACKYCLKSVCPMQHHNCLRLLEPSRVVSAVLDLYQERTPVSKLDSDIAAHLSVGDAPLAGLSVA